MTLDPDCLARAFDELKFMHAGKPAQWFDESKFMFQRVFPDKVDSMNRERYLVKTAHLLKGYKDYNVLTNGNWAWCSCSEEPHYGVTGPQPCTHIGGVWFYQLYQKHCRMKELVGGGKAS